MINGSDAERLNDKAPAGFLNRARKQYAEDIKMGKTSGHTTENVVPAAMGAWERGDCITCSVCGFPCPSCQTDVFNQAKIENIS